MQAPIIYMSEPNKPIIEQATIEDLPQLVDLLYDLFSHEGDFVPDREKQGRGLRLILEQPSRGRIFVYRFNEKILGMVNLLFTISTAEGGFVVLLEDVIVHHEYRGRGVGHQLLDHAIEYCKKKEFLRITLLTDRLNEEGQVFFTKMGFFKSQMIPLRMPLARDAATLPKG
jgi:GNAT superfamily N-acetyltransferase